MTPDTDETPVLFRAERTKELEVTAVFPTLASDNHGHSMQCYAHIGQHSGCSFDWYNGTRAAKPEEYAALKRELEAAPYGYRLKVYSRMQRQRFADIRRQSVRIRPVD